MCLNPIWLDKLKIYVSCGHCKDCYMKQTYDWAHRIMCEASAHKDNCVVTLTYDSDHLPANGLLRYKDVQDFHKRLRKHCRFRFFCSGEYGSSFGRPHYHDIIFGWKPDDLEYMFQRHGNRFYKSSFLNDVWINGFATVGTLTAKSALYCAKYLQKLNFSDMPIKPFVHMSLKPGIGACAYDMQSMFYSRRLYIDGQSYPLPRFYLKMLQRDLPLEFGDDYRFDALYCMRHVKDGVSSRDQLHRNQINSNWVKKFTLIT